MEVIYILQVIFLLLNLALSIFLFLTFRFRIVLKQIKYYTHDFSNPFHLKIGIHIKYHYYNYK
jgi:hypothetical protein